MEKNESQISSLMCVLFLPREINKDGNKATLMKQNLKWETFTSVYALAMKWQGHIALPLFVILSFCHYVIIHPQSLSQQPLHTFSSSFIYGYILWLKGWLLIWFRSDEPFRNMPPKLWKQMEIHSLILISTITHIQLKFVIWMYLTNTQFEFEFAFGLMTFDRDVPLELWKKWVCFCSLTFEGMHIHV